jgi:ubiquinone/menaquinone biosynthesis C-methylase UbiE
MSEDDLIFTDGDAYERLMGHWSRLAGSTFLDWLEVASGLRWLDVGCGTGAFTDLVCERCSPANICAIDPSEDQIKFAQSRPSSGRVEFKTGDAQNLPFDDAEFDVAAMALVINFVSNPPQAVAEMTRVVKPGGTVASYIWDFAGGRATQGPLIKAIKDMGIDVPSVPRIEYSRSDKLREMFNASGLDDISERKIDIQVEFANFDEYWSSQTGLATPAVEPILKMSSDEVEVLKASLKERLTASEDGQIKYPASVNAIMGIVVA